MITSNKRVNSKKQPQPQPQASGRGASAPEKARTIKLGVDVHLDLYVVVRVIHGGTPQPVLPKNSAETIWRIEPQEFLKDSPLYDDSTPIPPDRRRRLDEPTPAGCHRLPPGRESHPPGTTRWQTQALHRGPTHSAGAQSQARRPAPPGEIGHIRYSRHPPPLVPSPGRQKVDLCQGQSGRPTTRECGTGKTRGQTARRKPNLG